MHKIVDVCIKHSKYFNILTLNYMLFGYYMPTNQETAAIETNGMTQSER